MPVPDKVLQLIENFERNIESYKNQSYNEAQLRREFIDPFFETLGWDVANKAGYAPAYKDVIHEDAIKVGSATKAPDYCFRIGGARKFFLEAKKPSIDIKGDPHPAYQLRRYAWSAKLPLSILTDFEEFAVYDCRTRPKETDKAHTDRIMYFTYKDYVNKWNDIEKIFSKDAILKGSFDKYAVAAKGKRGTGTVDIEFLKEIENWRGMLARVIALRNTSLTVGEINFTVQRTIDRIIFLRMCEDRGIETYSQLLALSSGSNTYQRLFDVFKRADAKYNSGLFHFKKEKERENPDELTPNVIIDDKELKWILHTLYYPQCPYEFSVLPPEILGNVYEQFLGKVITLTKAHRANIEEKPEVKKAGGVYYTPSYIVDYIVKNTVGKLCEGKTPKQIEKIKILDPACGSGSFLLGAYTYVLNYIRDWYVENYPSKYTKQIYQGKAGQWFLTIAEKKKILLNNIFGVDIDSQAVEVTKLSLLLKTLEGETSETIGQTYKMFHKRALPDLANNIKCGNSLIGQDFFDNLDLSRRSRESGNLDELRQRINAFDWKAEFPEIFERKTPGFDAVIGNPPYIGFHGFKQEKAYLCNRYFSAKGKFDIYLTFIEKGIQTIKKSGLLGYICPTNFTKRAHGKNLRFFLSKKNKILQICDFEDLQIFSGPTNYTGIFIIENIAPSSDHRLLYKRLSIDNSGIAIPQVSLSEKPWIFRNKPETNLVQKLKSDQTISLGKIATGISEGIVTGQNSVFLLGKDVAMSLALEPQFLKPCIRGKEIDRYYLKPVKDLVIYPYYLDNKKTKVIPPKKLQDKTELWKYLNNHRKDLSKRDYFNKSTKLWYELWCQRNLNLLSTTKIVVPELSDRNRFTFTDKNNFYGDTVCGITLDPRIEENIFYVLGLLNSKLIEFYFKKTSVPKAGGFFIYKTMFLKNIPIRIIDFDNSEDVKKHDRMVSLVERMLDLHKKLHESKVPDEKTKIQRQIDNTDKQIDKLVYNLYGLTEDDIAIVENLGK